MFLSSYSGKKVLVTGHTGFKGSWLTLWLLKLGAHVSGYSDRVPTEPSAFDVLGLGDRIDHQLGDVRDLNALKTVFKNVKPDFVFHLAAQPIVSVSYQNPVETISTNVIGTVNVLECLRRADFNCTAVLITSDKCYENVEWLWGYRESDQLGGRDIYSGSKGAAELVIHSYFHSFFNGREAKARFATGRAGNVIGGGDWAKDRIIVDCMRSWSRGEPVDIRSPNSTRPWQHVLEPLSGYLALGAALAVDETLAGEAFNFGPRAEQNRTVRELLSDISAYWDFEKADDAFRVANLVPFEEAGLLKLNCDKALALLKWQANLEYEQCVRLVSEWYYRYYNGASDMYGLSLEQIQDFEQLAEKRGLDWVK